MIWLSKYELSLLSSSKTLITRNNCCVHNGIKVSSYFFFFLLLYQINLRLAKHKQKEKNDKINSNTSEKTECNLPFGEINCVHSICTAYQLQPDTNQKKNKKRKSSLFRAHFTRTYCHRRNELFLWNCFKGCVGTVYARGCAGSEISLRL